MRKSVKGTQGRRGLLKWSPLCPSSLTLISKVRLRKRTTGKRVRLEGFERLPRWLKARRKFAARLRGHSKERKRRDTRRQTKSETNREITGEEKKVGDGSVKKTWGEKRVRKGKQHGRGSAKEAGLRGQGEGRGQRGRGRGIEEAMRGEDRGAAKRSTEIRAVIDSEGDKAKVGFKEKEKEKEKERMGDTDNQAEETNSHGDEVTTKGHFRCLKGMEGVRRRRRRVKKRSWRMKELITRADKLAYLSTEFLIRSGCTVGVSFNTIVHALRLFHLTLACVDVLGADRRGLALACLSLSWKLWEDYEPYVARPQKLRDLARAMYLLLQPDTTDSTARDSDSELRLKEKDREQDTNLGTCSQSSTMGAGASLETVQGKFTSSAVSWMQRDGGAEATRLRDRIRLQEFVILRIHNFDIQLPDALKIVSAIPAACRLLCPYLEELQAPSDPSTNTLLASLLPPGRFPSQEGEPPSRRSSRESGELDSDLYATTKPTSVESVTRKSAMQDSPAGKNAMGNCVMGSKGNIALATHEKGVTSPHRRPDDHTGDQVEASPVPVIAAPENGGGSSFEALHSLALSVFLDFYRWPVSVNFLVSDVAFAAVFKAVLTLGLRICPSPDAATHAIYTRTLQCPNFPILMELLRVTYDTAAALNACHDPQFHKS